MDAGRLSRVFQVNVTDRSCAREAVRRMSTKYARFGGAIVNVSSAASRLLPGSMSITRRRRGDRDTFTIGLAKEVAEEGIRVNAVRPGDLWMTIHASGGGAGACGSSEGRGAEAWGQLEKWLARFFGCYRKRLDILPGRLWMLSGGC